MQKENEIAFQLIIDINGHHVWQAWNTCLAALWVVVREYKSCSLGPRSLPVVKKIATMKIFLVATLIAVAYSGSVHGNITSHLHKSTFHVALTTRKGIHTISKLEGATFVFIKIHALSTKLLVKGCWFSMLHYIFGSRFIVKSSYIYAYSVQNFIGLIFSNFKIKDSKRCRYQ